MELEDLPKGTYELQDFIYKVNRMSTVADSFKAIMNCDILPQYKMECIQWYNAYYGHQTQKSQAYYDVPSERHPPAELVIDSDERDRRIAEEQTEKSYRTWQHYDYLRNETPPVKTLPPVARQTWGDWRKSKIGFGGKTRKKSKKMK
jgi:hypothetical protein